MTLWLPWVVACALASASTVPAASDAVATSAAPSRPGQLGWGLGVELPLVGVATGIASQSHVGWGYTLGVALSWEWVTGWQGRAYLRGGETRMGTAPVDFLESGQRQRAAQPAQWFGMETGLGIAHIFRRPQRGWSPYVGFDAGIVYRGYDFAFDDSVAKLKTVDLSNAQQSGSNEALALGWEVGVRGGVQLEMQRWLAGQVELGVHYVPMPSMPITNTRQAREVRSVDDHIVMLRATYAIVLML